MQISLTKLFLDCKPNQLNISDKSEPILMWNVLPWKQWSLKRFCLETHTKQRMCAGFVSFLGFCGVTEEKLNQITDGIWYVPSLQVKPVIVNSRCITVEISHTFYFFIPYPCGFCLLYISSNLPHTVKNELKMKDNVENIEAS